MGSQDQITSAPCTTPRSGAVAARHDSGMEENITLSTQIAGANLEFGELFAESVDQGLSDLLGSNVKFALYEYWKTGFSISRDQMHLKVNDFGKALEKTFGLSHKTVGKYIAKRFYLKLGLDFTEKPQYGLAEYVRNAERSGGAPPSNDRNPTIISIPVPRELTILERAEIGAH